MELKDAVNIYHHICNTFGDDCYGCPFSDADIRCDLFDTNEVDEKEIAEWERVATEWWEHNKPVYPTLGNLIHYIINNAKDWPDNIYECFSRHIPEHIAKEFNLVPINEGGFTKYEKDREH